jgi:hypothetical protein
MAGVSTSRGRYITVTWATVWIMAPVFTVFETIKLTILENNYLILINHNFFL